MTSFVYVNGEIYENADGFVFERLGPTDVIPSLTRFAIASDQNGANQWEGRMDDFFVADNALSEADVAKVYSEGVRSVFTGLPAEPADYTPAGDVGLRLENIDGKLGGAVYVASVWRSRGLARRRDLHNGSRRTRDFRDC